MQIFRRISGGCRFHSVSIIVILITFAAVCINADKSSDEYKIVKTNYGLIRGKKLTSLYEGKEFYAYRGIPYAQPPVNELRFKPPVKIAKKWGDNVLDALDYGNECIQMNFEKTEIVGNEDCLFINVFVPNTNGNEKLPVMAFIHGGGFFEGSGNDFFFGPDLLINKNVILVTFNYRLGPFGFLNLGTKEYSGNMGLKDQNLALKWIVDNIANFNGDSNKITLFGHSAGAASTHFHTLSPLSESLFQRAIIMSGSALNNWAYNRESAVGHRAIMSEFAHLYDKIFTNLEDLIKFLQTVDGNALLKETLFLISDLVKKEITLKWLPVIEDASVPGAFITERPEITLQREDIAIIDTMFGVTDSEFLFAISKELNEPSYVEQFYNQFYLQMPNKRDIKVENYDTDNYRAMAEEVKKFYFDKKFTLDDDDLYKYISLLSDVFFGYGVDKSMKLQTKYSIKDTYYYRFTGVGKLNFFKHTFNVTKMDGASHGDELCYIFNCKAIAPLYDTLAPTTPERKLIESLTTLWSNFAKFGNPTPDDGLAKWKPTKTAKIVNFMDIGPRLITGLFPNARAYKFWDNLYTKYDENNNAIKSDKKKDGKKSNKVRDVNDEL